MDDEDAKLAVVPYNEHCQDVASNDGCSDSEINDYEDSEYEICIEEEYIELNCDCDYEDEIYSNEDMVCECSFETYDCDSEAPEEYNCDGPIGCEYVDDFEKTSYNDFPCDNWAEYDSYCVEHNECVMDLEEASEKSEPFYSSNESNECSDDNSYDADSSDSYSDLKQNNCDTTGEVQTTEIELNYRKHPSKLIKLRRIEMDKVLQRQVPDLSQDGIDKEPSVLAEFMDSDIKVDDDVVKTINYLHFDYMEPTITAHQVECTSSPSSLVPKSIPVNRINKIQTRTVNNLAAHFSTSGFQYPTNGVLTELKDFMLNSRNELTNRTQPAVNEHYDCPLELQPCRYCTETQFQLRGSDEPPWFPGMYTIFPGDSRIRLARTPSRLIQNGYYGLSPR